ncbi:MAG: DUF2911 domain-containing protein [Planctomycetes bacterium]|nr:DUF2911 domain-containing protein [Planctomycetota bacterium]
MRNRCLSFVLFTALCAAPAAAQGDDLARIRKQAEEAFQQQDWAAAAKHFQVVVQKAPEDAKAWHQLGYALHVQGQLDAALAAHLKAASFPETQAVGTYNVACVHALKKDKDQAFTWLAKAVEAGFSDADLLASDTDLNALHEDPRWAKLIARMQGAGGDAKGPDPQTVYAQDTVRRATRVAFFGRRSSAGQIAIQYGSPAWKTEHGDAVEAGKTIGKRWRFGADFWTTLDTSIPFQVGDVKVEPGLYYLVLEHTAKDTAALVLLDPVEVRKQRLDAYVAGRSKGGVAIPIPLQRAEEVANELGISLAKTKAQDELALNVRFGPYRLGTTLKLQLP